MEYGVRLAYIAPGIMQEVINAATAENSLTVRSFKAVIEGYLAFNFAAAEAVSSPDMGEKFRLEGSLQMQILLAGSQIKENQSDYRRWHIKKEADNQ